MNHLFQIPKSAINSFERLVSEIMEKQHAAGIAIAAVNADGKLLYQNFFGWRDSEKKLPIDENTIFGLASITKSFTSIAVLQMEEAGILSLDDPVSKYLPEYTGKNLSEPVKIRHFLSHAGGYFPLKRTVVNNVAQKLNITEEQEGDFAYSELLAKEGCKIVSEQMDCQKQLLCLPGERMSYCNDGFGLLSEIIRRYGEQMSFPEYLKEHILKPLGMTRSCADFLTPARDSNAATLYSKKENVFYADHDYHRSAFVLGGGGAMKSTLADMCKYLTMFLQEGKTVDGSCILSRRQIREMTKPRQENGPFSWYGYGLACRIVDQMTVWGHGGSLPGVSSHFAWSQDLGAGVVVLCNTEDVSVQILADAVLRMLHGSDPLPERNIWKDFPWTDLQKQKVLGEYRSDEEEGEFFLLETNHFGQLMLYRNGQKKEIQTISPHRILVKGVYSDSYIEIIRDEQENVYAARFGSRVYRFLS